MALPPRNISKDEREIKMPLSPGAGVPALVTVGACDPQGGFRHTEDKRLENMNELLLEAGADSGAVDSMGNSVLWYLERNEQLTTDERQSLHTLLGSQP
ncbi:hypothetical protein JCM17846_26350 [Iodidimonas nitroreducens]|uniref:Uncharacterized protein n=1 Tax=Iodidimonas nitroreducens TaxID=1236968 RepID=A0A5A7N9C6_9PROT|nr:hypothetical protein AQ1_00579 [alpha proteobacterium Q-1]GER04953.1 hypothetical protein JCM17846_26350 [Iodidimonas nitroreducens]